MAFAALVAVALPTWPASHVPATSRPFTENHENEVLIRFHGTVALPLEIAYVNLLRHAQFCWGRTSIEGNADRQWSIEDNLDLVAKRASIIVFTPSMGAGVAVASIRMQSEGTGTHVEGSALRSTPGAAHMGSEQIHLMRKWALGESTACNTP